MFYRLGDRGGDNQGNNSVTRYRTLFKLITERRSTTPHLSFPNMRYSANWSKRKKKTEIYSSHDMLKILWVSKHELFSQIQTK